MIALDTNIFIYHLSSDSAFGSLAGKLFHQIEEGKIEAVASFISYSEIVTFPAKQKRDDLVQKYADLLLEFPNLTFTPVHQSIAHEAALLRARYDSIKLMDAFILATAISCKAKVLITEDKNLKLKNLPIPVKTLAEYFG